MERTSEWRSASRTLQRLVKEVGFNFFIHPTDSVLLARGHRQQWASISSPWS